MMAKALATAEIEASADAVYDLLADFGSVGWMKGVTKVELAAATAQIEALYGVLIGWVKGEFEGGSVA